MIKKRRGDFLNKNRGIEPVEKDKVRDDYSDLKVDIAEIKTTVKHMCQQITELSNSYKKLPDKVHELEKSQIELSSRLEDCEKRIKKVEDDKDALNRKVWGIIITIVASVVIWSITQGVSVL